MKDPNAIAVLAASIVYENGRWRSTDLTEEDDKYGAPGGRQRVEATALLCGKWPGAFIVTTGGMGYDVASAFPKERPLLCEILKDELLESSVEEKRIILEKNSNNTYQELLELEKIFTKRKWRTIAIITSKWHIPRVRAMLEAKFQKFQKGVDLITAEDILISEKRVSAKRIEEVYSSDFMKKRIELEARGVRQIKDESYRYI